MGDDRRYAHAPQDSSTPAQGPPYRQRLPSGNDIPAISAALESVTNNNVPAQLPRNAEDNAGLVRAAEAHHRCDSRSSVPTSRTSQHTIALPTTSAIALTDDGNRAWEACPARTTIRDAFNASKRPSVSEGYLDRLVLVFKSRNHAWSKEARRNRNEGTPKARCGLSSSCMNCAAQHIHDFRKSLNVVSRKSSLPFSICLRHLISKKKGSSFPSQILHSHSSKIDRPERDGEEDHLKPRPRRARGAGSSFHCSCICLAISSSAAICAAVAGDELMFWWWKKLVVCDAHQQLEKDVVAEVGLLIEAGLVAEDDLVDEEALLTDDDMVVEAGSVVDADSVFEKVFCLRSSRLFLALSAVVTTGSSSSDSSSSCCWRWYSSRCLATLA
ncbi:hypothetical protein KCU92_g355, partial [Aureobasidium melanogenum]